MDWIPAGRLDNTGYPPIEVSYGRDTHRAESILILSILPLLSNQPYLSHRIGIYPIHRIQYTARVGHPMEWIPAERNTKWHYRIANQRIPARRSILWAGWPQVGVYRKPIYSISHILSILYNMASILQDMDLSYLSYSIYLTGRSIIWIGYQPGAVRNGPIELATVGLPTGRSILRSVYLPGGVREDPETTGYPRAEYPLGGIPAGLS